MDSQQVEAGGHQLTVREREDRAADQPGVLSLHPLEADRGRAKGQTSPSRQRDLVSLEISTLTNGALQLEMFWCVSCI